MWGSRRRERVGEGTRSNKAVYLLKRYLRVSWIRYGAALWEERGVRNSDGSVQGLALHSTIVSRPRECGAIAEENTLSNQKRPSIEGS